MLSDFIKKAYKMGKVKKYSECYMELPQEDRNFYIGEKIVKYPRYDIGDIIFVKNYHYKNGEKGNNHLFVIIDDDNHGIPLNYFCMIVSSKVGKDVYESNIRLNKDEINNLNKDSIVKTDEIFEINSNEINFTIGKVNTSLINTYIDMYLNNEDLEYV